MTLSMRKRKHFVTRAYPHRRKAQAREGLRRMVRATRRLGLYARELQDVLARIHPDNRHQLFDDPPRGKEQLRASP